MCAWLLYCFVFFGSIFGCGCDEFYSQGRGGGGKGEIGKTRGGGGGGIIGAGWKIGDRLEYMDILWAGGGEGSLGWGTGDMVSVLGRRVRSGSVYFSFVLAW